MWGVGSAVEFEGEGLFGGRVRKRKMGPVVRDKMCVGGKDARRSFSDGGGAGGGEGGRRGFGWGKGGRGSGTRICRGVGARIPRLCRRSAFLLRL